jgi:exodeoxyribonuclease VII large subunit
MQRQQLRLLDPRRQLERGYAIVRGPEGDAIRDAAQLEEAQTVDVVLGRGSFGATVTQVKTHEDPA